MSDEITVGGGSYYGYGYISDRELLELEPVPPTFDEELESVRKRVESLIRSVPIPKFPERAHRQIRKLLDADEERRLKYAASRWPSSWDKPLFDDPVEVRRLRLINAIMTALERAGMKPKIEGGEGRSLSVTVNDTTVRYTLDATSQKLDPRYRNAVESRGASKKLRCVLLVSGSGSAIHAQWEDTEKTRLDTKLREIVIELIYFAEVRHRESSQSHYEWLVERKADLLEKIRKQKEEAERKERERLAALKRARVESLLSDAEAFRKANDIRAFVGELTARFEQGAIDVSSDRMTFWCKWALAQADNLDPVSNGRFTDFALNDERAPG